MSLEVIEPSGILDGGTANDLRQEIRNAIDKGAKTILIDFKNITFVNSSGLGALVSMLKNVRTAGGELYLCSLNDQVKMIFELTRMERVFKTFANQEEFEKQVLAG